MKRSSLILTLVIALVFSATSAFADMPTPDKGFHIAIGAGPSGHFQNGIANRIKIGYTFGDNARLYYLAQHHNYFVYFPEYDADTASYKTDEDDVSELWFTGIHALGFDYFIYKGFAFTAAVGLGVDMVLVEESSHTDAKDDFPDENTPFKDDNIYGFSAIWGFSIPVAGNSEHSLTLDPAVQMFWRVVEGAEHAVSSNIYYLTASYNFH